MTGYRIYWSEGSNQGSEDAGASATDLTITIPQPQSSLTYSITIVALSTHLPSTVVGPTTVTVGKQSVYYCLFYTYVLAMLFLQTDLPPTAPIVTPGATTPTSVVISWNQQSSVDSYEISFQRATGSQQLGDCSSFEHSGNASVTGSITTYNLTDLQEFSTYVINVTAVNGGGRNESDPLAVNTQMAGI